MRIRFVSTARNLLVIGILALSVPSAGYAQDGSAAPPPIGRLVDIGGRRLHINCTGSGGPTVVVENGSSGFSMEWALVQSKVAAFTRICTYDRAGYAWSDRGPEENTVEETMDDLHLLLRSASVAGPYVLAGQSIGGMYVRAYQRRYPKDVVGLVLVDATPEEDLEYLWNGKSTAGVFLTYDALASVYAPYIKNPPRRPPLDCDEAWSQSQRRIESARGGSRRAVVGGQTDHRDEERPRYPSLPTGSRCRSHTRSRKCSAKATIIT